ncbi:MAG: L-threonylcarbamoyladenylate synthase [Bacteroidota bacterium]
MNNEISNALKALNSGGLILYPTDTIWGIGCDSLSDNAVKKIFNLKKRDLSKPLICLASSYEMINEYADINNLKILKKISKNGPSTFIFLNPKKISKYVTSDGDSIAFRIPKDEFCIRLIQEFGKPIISTSANISNDNIPHSFNEINNQIIDKVDYIVNHRKNDICNNSSSIYKLEKDGNLLKLR